MGSRWRPLVHCPKAFAIKKMGARIYDFKFSVLKIPTWIKLFNVPMELFTTNGLSHVGSAVGNPLYLEKATE